MHTRSFTIRLITAASCLLALPASAEEKFNFLTNWYAQAEQGGFYQALAQGTYKAHGLDVNMRMGGPQVNSVQILAAGQADCIMGSTDIQMMQARESGVPLMTVAAFFQKDPSVLIAHEDVQRIEDLKTRTLYIAGFSGRSFLPWLKNKYGLSDAQIRPIPSASSPSLPTATPRSKAT